MMSEEANHQFSVSNVVMRSPKARMEIGYEMNVVEFSWTSAAFLKPLRGLPKEMVKRLEKDQDQPLPGGK